MPVLCCLDFLRCVYDWAVHLQSFSRFANLHLERPHRDDFEYGSQRSVNEYISWEMTKVDEASAAGL